MLAGLLALALSGCGSSSDPAGPAPLPDGVSVAVYQSRADVPADRLQIQIVNGSGVDLTVSAASFGAPQFASPALWQRGSTVVAAGRTVDLPVTLTEAVCVEGDPAPTVRLGWAVDGGIRSSEVVPIDERDRLEELRAEGCFVEAVDRVAAFSLETPPRTVTIGDVIAAELEVTLTPGDGSGGDSLRVTSVSGTTLFTHLDLATGETSTITPLGVSVAAGEARTITVTLVPTRCDPHAVAEDKQGTIMPFAVDVIAEDGSATRGTVAVAAPAEIKEQLIAFLGEACLVAG